MKQQKRGFPYDSDGKESACPQESWVQSLGWEDPLEEAQQPTPVFLPGESHGQRSLVGYRPWSRKDSDATEQLTLSFSFSFSLHDQHGSAGGFALGHAHSRSPLMGQPASQRTQVTAAGKERQAQAKALALEACAQQQHTCVHSHVTGWSKSCSQTSF